ncbi:DUF1684 domain-containing protein [Spirillospora sp. CA-253888]
MTESLYADWDAWRRDRVAELAAVYGAECPAFPPDPRWITTARYQRYERPRWEAVGTATGNSQEVPVHGILRFTLEGVECSLEPYSSGPPGFLNVAFRDLTSGLSTYGAARVIFPPVPPPGVFEVVLDFNRSINPPCAFTPYAACAFPPARNTVPIAVEAGEKAPATHDRPSR